MIANLPVFVIVRVVPLPIVNGPVTDALLAAGISCTIRNTLGTMMSSAFLPNFYCNKTPTISFESPW